MYFLFSGYTFSLQSNNYLWSYYSNDMLMVSDEVNHNNTEQIKAEMAHSDCLIGELSGKQ
jgi:hypothetical protein